MRLLRVVVCVFSVVTMSLDAGSASAQAYTLAASSPNVLVVHRSHHQVGNGQVGQNHPRIRFARVDGPGCTRYGAPPQTTLCSSWMGAAYAQRGCSAALR